MMAEAGADLFNRTCFNYPTLGDLYEYATYTAMLKRDGLVVHDSQPGQISCKAKMKLGEGVVPLCQFQSSSSGQVCNSGTSQTGHISCKAKGGTGGSHAADSRRSKRYFPALPSSFTLIDGKMV